MPLYIERYVVRDFGFLMIQTPWFHSISPLVALLVTPLIARFHEKLNARGKKVFLPNQIVCAFILLFLKLLMVCLSSYVGSIASLFIFIGYVCSGVGILLLVPKAYQIIVKVKDTGFGRILVGCLYLMMVFAYLGATGLSKMASKGSIVSLEEYQTIFDGLTFVTGGLVLLLFYCSRVLKRRKDLLR
tara:strand:+ start:2117 stop:2677 length:561 start_codon:yes stop_codon:yes gene_type:complete